MRCSELLLKIEWARLRAGACPTKCYVELILASNFLWETEWEELAEYLRAMFAEVHHYPPNFFDEKSFPIYHKSPTWDKIVVDTVVGPTSRGWMTAGPRSVMICCGAHQSGGFVLRRIFFPGHKQNGLKISVVCLGKSGYCFPFS